MSESEKNNLLAAWQDTNPFQMILNNIPLPVWIFDLDSLFFLEVNSASEKLYGYTREEFLSMRITDIRPEDEAIRLKELLRHKSNSSQYSGEWVHCLKSGQLINVKITSNVMEYGNHKAVLVIVEEITDLPPYTFTTNPRKRE
jgi:PAS domain S-box-containing protein